MSMKSMAVMFGAMALMRRIDQEEPKVLFYARIFYMSYVAFTGAIYLYLHHRIVSRKDMTPITVPVTEKAPSMKEAFAKAQAAAEAKSAGEPEPKPDEEEDSDKKPKEKVISVMEYDLGKLAAARKSWATNACILAAIHYKMESVSPLIMSCLMGTFRLLADNQLVQIHIRGAPAVGDLKRPFQPPKNPFADMMAEMQKNQEEAANKDAADQNGQTPTAVEELHDDGEDEDEDDGPPPTIDDLKDDHIKGDFDDDDDDEAAEESKKTK